MADDQSQAGEAGEGETTLSNMSLLSRTMYPNDPSNQPPGGGEAGNESGGGDEGGTAGDAGDGEAGEGDEAGDEEDAAGEGGEEEAGSGESGDDGEETGDGEGGEAQGEELELDEESLLEQPVTVKVNGKESQVPIREAVKSYQTMEAAKEELDSAKQFTQEKRQEYQQKLEFADQQYQTAANIIQEAEKLLKSDSDNVDWKTLREQDPSEWSAKKAEFDERQRKIDELKNQTVSQYQQASQQTKQELQKQQQEMLQQEQQKLLERLPEWSDEEKAKAGKTQLAKYLKSEGFSDEDLNSLVDHRLVVIANKARQFDELQKKPKPSRKRVRKAGKTVTPGSQSKSGDKGQSQQANDPVSILYPSG